MQSKVVPIVFINGKELKNVMLPVTIYDRYISLRVANPKTACVDTLSFPLEEVEIVMEGKDK